MMGRMQGWMLGVIRRHGFLGILLLASWPNAAFDLCGICCGHFQMPFWQFFGATFLGKALVKVCQLLLSTVLRPDGVLPQKMPLVCVATRGSAPGHSDCRAARSVPLHREPADS